MIQRKARLAGSEPNWREEDRIVVDLTSYVAFALCLILAVGILKASAR